MFFKEVVKFLFCIPLMILYQNQLYISEDVGFLKYKL